METTTRDIPLAQYLDATLLKPETDAAQLRDFVTDAAQFGVKAVCFSPSFLPFEVPQPVKTAVVVGFPSGKHATAVKAYEAKLAVENGADELDMVIDIAAATQHDFAAVEADIAAVVAAATSAGADRDTVVKVILETAALDDAAIVSGCLAAESAGAHFVKTSTGFHPAGGASLRAVELMARTVDGRLGVKASGGIRNRATALQMINAGATRLGVSAYREILAEPAPR